MKLAVNKVKIVNQQILWERTENTVNEENVQFLAKEWTAYWFFLTSLTKS